VRPIDPGSHDYAYSRRLLDARALLTTSAKRSPLAESRPASGVIAVDVILSHPSALKLVNGVRGAPVARP